MVVVIVNGSSSCNTGARRFGARTASTRYTHSLFSVYLLAIFVVTVDKINVSHAQARARSPPLEAPAANPRHDRRGGHLWRRHTRPPWHRHLRRRHDHPQRRHPGYNRDNNGGTPSLFPNNNRLPSEGRGQPATPNSEQDECGCRDPFKRGGSKAGLKQARYVTAMCKLMNRLPSENRSRTLLLLCYYEYYSRETIEENRW
jgi:hypothetical protein